MESFLVALLIFILFMEHGGQLREQLLIAIRANRLGILKYFGSAAVLAITLSFLPALMISLYMRANGFFAYEVFGDQQQAIQVLSLNVLANFLILSVFLFSTALLWAAKVDKVSIGVSIVVTTFMVLLFVSLAISSGRYDLFISIFVFCLILGGYLLYLVKNNFSDKARLWWVPLAFSVGLIVLSLIGHDYSVLLTENALAQMKVGGVYVEISEPLGFQEERPEKIVTGMLLLRTSEFLYLKPSNNQNDVLIISTDNVSLRYESKPKSTTKES